MIAKKKAKRNTPPHAARLKELDKEMNKIRADQKAGRSQPGDGKRLKEITAEIGAMFDKLRKEGAK